MDLLLAFAMIVTVAVGALVFANNPERLTNRIFSLIAVSYTVILLTVYEAIKAGDIFTRGGGADPVPWLRANGAINGFMPLAFRLLLDSLLYPAARWQVLLRRNLAWVVCGCGFSALILTEWYIPFDSTPARPQRGSAYGIACLFLIIAHVAFIVQAWLQLRTLKGIRRIELQFLVFNLGLGSLLSVTSATMGNLLQMPSLKNASIIASSALFVITAWSIFFQRILNIRQAATLLLHRLTATAAIAIPALFFVNVLQLVTSPTAALLVTVITACLSAAALEIRSRTWFGLNSEMIVAQMRHRIIQVARSEPRASGLVSRFEAQLIEETDASFASVAPEHRSEFRIGQFHLTPDCAAYSALCELSYATPETLLRRRATSAIDVLQKVLTNHQLGLILVAPRGSPAPTLLIALGTRKNEWPYTHPEIERLQNIAELMDNILTRSRLAEQAALQTKMDHLAMMSRGLAHDLKNLITPVSSFLVHTDGAFEPHTPAGEVHAAARRSVRVMTEYIREALFFSERLQPNFEHIELSRIFEAVRDITAAQAKRRGVLVLQRLAFTQSIVADAVLLQRMLTNLVGNAIDASKSGGTVSLVAASPCAGWLHLKVTDQGCGIDPANISRVFDAYFTTKEFGDDIRGFGLGLTIAQKIADLHCGVINVESQLGEGTTITVELPLSQPSFNGAAPRRMIDATVP